MSAKRIALASTLFLVIGCASSQKTDPAAPGPASLPHTITEAVNSPLRSGTNIPRDIYRHPVETLTFFGVQPGQTVIEIWPSSGWYTEILAPLLTDSGTYIAATSAKDNPETKENNGKMATWMRAHSNVKVKVTTFDPPGNVDIAPEGSADVVLTFRNVHNWMNKHAEQAAFNAFFKALKHGGTLGVVEHRAFEGKKKSADGYVKTSTVMALAKKAGFKLAEKSEINANPKDSKNYENGVWTLPPVNRHDAADDAKYLGVGESDRMTLRFIKP